MGWGRRVGKVIEQFPSTETREEKGEPVSQIRLIPTWVRLLTNIALIVVCVCVRVRVRVRADMPTPKCRKEEHKM